MDDSRTVDDVACSFSREGILDLAEAWVLPVVLDLDRVHGELTGESWWPPPSDRWHRLAEDFLERTPTVLVAGRDLGARPFLVTAAAFLLAESGDLDGSVRLLPTGRRTDRIRGLLRDAAVRAGYAVTHLLERAGSDHAAPQPEPVRAAFAIAGGAAAVSRPLLDLSAAVGWTGRHRGRPPVREARRLQASVGEAIHAEEVLGSVRHRQVSLGAKTLSLVCVLAIDLPVTMWLSTAVLGLDLARSDAVGVAVCVVVALVATAGVAVLPYQLGHDHRAYKTPDRQLCWSAVPPAAQACLAAVTLLIAVVSTAVLVAVVRAGAFVGHDLLPQLIAAVVVLALPVSAGMAYWLAFRDGSPERDALERASRHLLWRLQQTRRSEDRAAAGDRRLRLLRCRDHRERLEVQLDELVALAARALDEPVLGPRGHLLTVAEAEQRRDAVAASVAAEAARGSGRHRRTATGEKVLGAAAALVGLPVLLTVPLASFGPDPSTAARVVAVVLTVALTAGIAAGLHHVGRDQREAKGADGRLRWRALGVAARVNLVGIGLLAVLVAAAVVVSTRFLLDGAVPPVMAQLLALGAASVLPVAVATMFRAAFRDGSIETDDLAYYARVVAPHRRLRRELLAEADVLRTELARHRGGRDEPVDAVAVDDVAARPPRVAVRGAGRLTTPVALTVLCVTVVTMMLGQVLLGDAVGPMLPFVTILVMTLIAIGRTCTHHRRGRPGRDRPIARQLDLLPDLPPAGVERLSGRGSPTVAAAPATATGPDWTRS